MMNGLREMLGALPAGSRVTVAFSGGEDSVTLLHLLKEWQDRPFELAAAHVNHGLRPEAEQEAVFCAELCRAWGIPLQIFRGDAAAYAAERGMSTEEGARALRYGFLDTLVGENSFVVTAHHREDQLETFFINLYRGSGSRGLSGIPAQRGGYLRPLLQVEKGAISAYVKKNKLLFVTDSSNRDESYQRNFIRRRVLPLLQSREEGDFAKGLAASMEHLREEEEALSLWADRCTDYRAEALAALPNAVLKRVLDRLRGASLSRVQFRDVAALVRACPPSGQLQVAEGCFFRVEYGECRFVFPTEAPPLQVVLGQPVQVDGQKILICSEEINSSFTHSMVDCAKIKGALYLRRKKDGDRFRPAGKRGGTERLQKRLKNDRIPRSRRDSLWVLAEAQDRVVWVEGYGAAEGFGCDAETKRVLRIEIGGE